MTAALPAISIVTCSYQQARFLDSTLRSVLGQNYEPLEYIVMDGGSNDGSVEIIRNREAKLAHWVSQKDGGQTDALRQGFERSSGEIMGWLCSDDLLLPGALDTVGRIFAAHPEVDWLYGDALWIDAAGALIRPKKEMPWSSTVFLFDHNYLAQPSVFWRRHMYEAVGGLDARLNLTMDADLWLRFARLSRPRYVSEFLSCMRYYPDQKTRLLRADGRREDELLRRREAPGLSRLPRAPLRAVARAMRIGLKAVHGGYGAATPPTANAWLEGLAIKANAGSPR